MYNFVSPTEIKPRGWVKRQLELQRDGLCGNLDKVWPDVRDSAWIGGDREGWERVPYWLDGFLPMAYYLDDKDAIARAERYVTAILDRQQEDGWICPCTQEERATYDLWGVFLIGKVLANYCELTGSERAEKALYRTMRNLYDLMKAGEVELAKWAKHRWYECFIPLQYLHERYKEDWMLELARMLREQGANFWDFVESWKRPLNKWTQYTHIVNLVMMLKYEAVSAKLLGEEVGDAAERLWKILEKYNGTAVGSFTGDECLSGISNTRGTELCSVVELMYTCELLYAITRKPVWGERLEKLAFNALPATISDDMWTHQYLQQVNQINCIRFPGHSYFRTNNSEAHLFGLEPHFGCCTANFGQGWPRLLANNYIKENNSISVTTMIPSELHTTMKGVPVIVRIETEYPFRMDVKISVTAEKSVDFALKLRIPSYSKTYTVNGVTKNNKTLVLRKFEEGETIYTITLSDTPHMVTRPFGLKTVEYGPLVFSLPLEVEYSMKEYVRNDVERKYPYCDYELSSKSEWRYGFAEKQNFTVTKQEGDDVPFSSKAPLLTMKASLRRVGWDFAEGYDTVASPKPISNRALGAAEEFELVPYGCAKLRMTEMPIAKDK
ncbi:MAG: glycoside hydrolase family 127 protein [Clostridia bacterium]|nr:glycoside hydrolase family 127 protein [Clostridia bacterium]